MPDSPNAEGGSSASPALQLPSEAARGNASIAEPLILGIGMSVLDSTHLVDEFPGSGGITELDRGVLSGGGPVPTALCAAARLGVSSAAIEHIGDDWRGDLIAADYHNFGVSTAHVFREVDTSTPAATILVRRRDGERHILFEQGDCGDLQTEELPLQALQRCRFLHLNGRHLKASLAAARIVRESGGAVSFDGGAQRYHPRLEPLLDLADILVVARDFAAKRSGPTVPQDPASLLIAMANSAPNAALLGVTDGANGAWLLERADDSAPWHQPACDPGGIVDTTGCGDVFHGALLAARTEGSPWREAAWYASAAAALAASALGGRGCLPERDAVESLIARSLS